MGRMMPGAYQLVAIRGEVEVFQAGFDDRDEATRALAEVLVWCIPIVRSGRQAARGC